MKRLFAVAILLCILVLPEAAYSGKNDIVIERGAEVLVKIMERLKSNKAQVGQTIRFVVERGVRNEDGFVLIPDGALAYGKVTKVAKAGFFGAGGKLGISIDSVEAYNGKNIQLSSSQENEGENVTAWGAGIFRGTNAVIEAGTVFTAYVTHTTVLEERPDQVNVPAVQQTAPVRVVQVQQQAPAQQTAPVRVVQVQQQAPVQQTVPTQVVQVQQPAPAQQTVPVRVIRQSAPAPTAAPVQQPAPIQLPAPEKREAEQDKGYDFILVNNSGYTFRNVWLSASGKINWTDREKIKLPNRIFKSGESMKVIIPTHESVSYLSKRKIRYCDIRVELINGKFWQWLKNDLSGVDKITILDRDELAITR